MLVTTADIAVSQIIRNDKKLVTDRQGLMFVDEDNESRRNAILSDLLSTSQVFFLVLCSHDPLQPVIRSRVCLFFATWTASGSEQPCQSAMS